MSRQYPYGPIVKSALMASICALALTGCEKLTGTADTTAARGTPGVLRIEEREVERPDIFEMNSRGLWDGRPSLGGRWVAVARDIKAETVLITNKDNGQEIRGALFKLEEGRAGPPILVSSEAAEALNMLPGSPAEMRIVAVRTETVEIPPEPAPVTEESAEEDAEPPAAAVPLPDASLETTVLEALDAPAAGATAAAGATVAAAAPAPAAATGSRYIQVASGSNKQGADAALRKITGANLPGTIRTSGSEAKPVYRVVAGPFADGESISSALATLKGVGFKDAFATR